MRSIAWHLGPAPAEEGALPIGSGLTRRILD